uniref:ABC transporter, ATP-binding protein n=1 Tax=Angiostrongylus cantonensis TaxID=6313 RepID=A0A158P6K3_ANGCA
MTFQHVGNDLLWNHAIHLCFGILLFILSYLQKFQHYFLRLASRNIFVMAVLRQNATWFDKNCAGAITTQLNENVSQIEDGIGDKMGMLARGISTLIACVTFALVSSWRITLVCVGVAPVSVITMAIMSRVRRQRSHMFLSETLFLASEINSLQQLKNGLPFAIRYGFICGFFEGFMFFQLYVFYAAAFLYVNVLKIFRTQFQKNTSTHGSYFFGLLGPHMMAIEKARMAAAIIYETIDAVKHSFDSEDGEEMHSCEGRLEFKDVHFKYPSRETPVLLGLSWFAEPGETIAFVGKSGCGKSTSIGLLTRLHDCHKGSMLIDGRDIRTIKIRDLRKMIGIVQQEPCLFNGTILENIVLGRPISDEQAKDAARMANAHDFIVKLEKGYETVIGTGGVTLSGGQKQRLAIARAVAAEPRILLLDEATSALDSESEKIVQLALNKASRGRTTVVIAHRLSTLKDVQRIYAIEGGKIVEEGTHLELMEKGGLYSSLAKAQEIGVGVGPRQRKTSESFDSIPYFIVCCNATAEGKVILQIGFGGWSADAATSNIRVEVLRSLLSQNAEFFDRPHRSNAECVAELSSKAPDIQAVCSTYSYTLMKSTNSQNGLRVAKNLNLVARNGQAIALVGASGCGKSTVIQLLERFYEPDAGAIKIDNFALNKICRVHLRNNIALVGQEPILFKGSRSLQAALIRKPKIILLDEATSALDTESEKIVQKALNEASHDRTSLTIAHRLSTIKDKLITYKRREVCHSIPLRANQTPHTHSRHEDGSYKINNTNVGAF